MTMTKQMTKYVLLAALVTGVAMATASAQHSGGEHRRRHDHDEGHDHDHPPRRPRARMNAVDLPEPETQITIEGDQRVIRTNGVPNHPTGTFPNAGNPNAIRLQQGEFRVPVTPERLESPLPARGSFGMALNGIPFDAGTGEFWTPSGREGPGSASDWNYEALDGSIDLGIDLANAHVQPTGRYHYHGHPSELVRTLEQDGAREPLILVGWAADGFPIYVAGGSSSSSEVDTGVRPLTSSYRLKQGTRPEPPEGPGGVHDGTFTADWEYVEGLGTLDECNGAFGVTPEFPDGSYFYLVTEQFPFVPRYWRGQPDASFERAGPPPGERPAGGPRAR